MTRTCLRAALALALLSASSACGSAKSGLEGEDSLDLDVCDGTKWRSVKGLSPKNPVDYVSLRRVSFGPPGTADEIVDEDGVACSGASDVGECTAAMARVHSNTGWAVNPSIGFSQEYLSVTVADDRVNYTSTADLLKFLGPIDTAAEAALVASTTGQSVVCGQPNVQQTADGFRVLTAVGPACGDVRTNIVLVRPDGTTTIIASAVTRATCGGYSSGMFD